MKWSLGVALGFAAALSFARPAHAAVDGYLKIDGIEGESQDDKHKDWIEISSFNAPITSGNIGGGAGRGKVRPTGGEITVTKHTDAASPKLYEALHNGTHIPKVIIELTRPTGKSPMVYELSDVMVSSYQMGSGPGATETMTMRFGSMAPVDKPQTGGTTSGLGGVHGPAPRAPHLPPPGGAD